MDEPIISTSFLDLEQHVPDLDLMRFEVPRGAGANLSEAPDFARAVDRYSPYVLPDPLVGESRRSEEARGAATYGEGYSLIAALALPVRFLPEDRLTALPRIAGPWDSARVAESPLLNALTVIDGEVAFVLGGTVSTQKLIDVATELTETGVGVRS
jgi:hypothetical protein